jgi:hypothetical protein
MSGAESPLEVALWQEPWLAGSLQCDFTNTITLSEKFSSNDKYGTGSLVAREGAVTNERR